jgi:AraC-like DNA-binding protein
LAGSRLQVRCRNVLGRFTVLEVRDPHLIGQSAWESLPPRERALLDERQFTAREWLPLDRRRFRMEPESYLTQYSIANVGAVLGGRITDSRATEFRQRSPGVAAVWITMFEQGAGRVVLPGSNEPALGNVAAGWIWGGDPGTSGASSDGASRLFPWLPVGLLRRRLEALLDGEKVESIAFQPVFDPTRGAGATIRRLSNLLFAELEDYDSLLTNEIAIRSFEEHLALCLLVGLPHNYSERLHCQKASATPANVKRAEEFMRANASVPLTIEAIANAVGCSIRSLQLAFRRFRGTTPMAALQRIRLEAARAEVLRIAPGQSLARIAAEYGFSNPSRFAQLFRRAWGTYPSEAVRVRRDLTIGHQQSKAQVRQPD